MFVRVVDMDSYSRPTAFRDVELTASDVGINYADAEVVAGSGTSWTLAHAPAPTVGLRLYSIVPNFGGVLLVKDSANSYGFTVSGTAVTTVSSFSAGALLAWYRY